MKIKWQQDMYKKSTFICLGSRIDRCRPYSVNIRKWQKQTVNTENGVHITVTQHNLPGAITQQTSLVWTTLETRHLILALNVIFSPGGTVRFSVRLLSGSCCALFHPPAWRSLQVNVTDIVHNTKYMLIHPHDKQYYNWGCLLVLLLLLVLLYKIHLCLTVIYQQSCGYITPLETSRNSGSHLHAGWMLVFVPRKI